MIHELTQFNSACFRLLAHASTLAVAGLLGTGTGFAATEYVEDGILNEREEAHRWRINRARYNPEQEADRLGLVNTSPGGSPHYDACEDIDGSNAFGTTPEEWDAWVTSKGPLAANAQLCNAAIRHTQDLIEAGKFQHHSPTDTYYPLNSMPWQRSGTEGYNNQISGYLENLAKFGWGSSSDYPAFASTVSSAHDSLFLDGTAEHSGTTELPVQDQGVTVLAVPGPIDAATSEGSNQLLRDGAAPVLDVGDVLALLGLEVADVPTPAAAPDVSAAGRRVLEALRHQPSTPDALSRRLGCTAEALAAELSLLELLGCVAKGRDGRLRVV